MTFDYGLYQALLCAQARCELVLDDAAPGLAVLSRMRACGATVVPLVPSLADFLAFLASRMSGTPPVRLFTSTGAPLGAASTAALRRCFPGARICLMYGLTECKRVAIMPPDHDLARPASSGLPMPGTAVRILADGLLTREPGVQGEIIVAGPHVMAGYWRDQAATAARFRRDPATGRRQLHTGDLGWLDRHGYLYVAGRLDDVFSWRGLRMSRQEVEAAALSIPGVRAAVVLPPVGHRDMILFAVGCHSGPALLRLIAGRLDARRVPARCVILDRIPVTDRGKVDLTALGAMPSHVAQRRGRP
jgi:acyl-CoA synthetase (AMP-forming)/AMP-acid ligase II